jgi:hypothetical protein
MRTFPSTRKRYASEPMVTVGGLTRILQGIFGKGSPVAGLAAQRVTQDPAKEGGPFHFFEGDIWTPGTSNWILDPPYETPLNTVWGHAFLRIANGFNPLQPPQIYTQAASYLYGVSGQIAGQMVTQPLSENIDTGAA